MSYAEQVENVTIGERRWLKIIGDTAFESILEGFDAYNTVWSRLVKNKGVAIQAGGYCGVFPRLLAESFDTVYTFEPDPLNFFCLTLNCQTDNVIKAQGALGKSNGLVEVFRTNAHNKGMNIVRPTESSFLPTYRIDDLCLASCDLIALDTEGYEMNILYGAENIINEYKPVITIEDPTPDIDSFLHSKGYKLQIMIHGRDAVYTV
jgi:FkbM family methyltransferase